MNQMIPLRQLAAELGVDASNARKIALKLGFIPVRRQMPDLGHRQRTLCWTRDQVEAIKAQRRKEGFEVPA